MTRCQHLQHQQHQQHQQHPRHLQRACERLAQHRGAIRERPGWLSAVAAHRPERLPARHRKAPRPHGPHGVTPWIYPSMCVSSNRTNSSHRANFGIATKGCTPSAANFYRSTSRRLGRGQRSGSPLRCSCPRRRPCRRPPLGFSVHARWVLAGGRHPPRPGSQ